MLPRITIITPCRDNADLVRETIDSVLRQRYPALEHIVIDACSTDGTLEILKSYGHLLVVSEPDAGPHDAMNKGLARASGEIIGFLNADDLYPENMLEVVGRRFTLDPTIDLVAGHCVYFRDGPDDTRLIVRVRTHERDSGLWLPELMFGIPGINGCFFRRRAFERIGEFDNSYHLGGDRHWMLRAALAGLRAAWLNTPTIWYRMHPASRTFNPAMRNLMPIGEEHFRMAAEFSDATRNRPELRRNFLAWHAFEGAKLELRWTLRGRFGHALRVFWELVRRNPLWLLRLRRALAMRRETQVQARRDMRLVHQLSAGVENRQ
jgi:glycosyltransferase involved in cell wall biosynthesis